MCRITVIFTQFLLLVNTTNQSHVRQAITTIKAIGKTIKSPLLKQIGNTIIKPIIKTFSNTKKNSLGIFRQRKNTIKNVAFGIQEKYLRTRNNFGTNPIKYIGERHNYGSKTIKYLQKEGVKKFKHMKPQTIKEGKRNIQMRSDAQMKGKELRSLINTVSQIKPQLPLLFVTGSLGKLAQFNLVPSDGDTKESSPEDKKQDKDAIKPTNSDINDTEPIKREQSIYALIKESWRLANKKHSYKGVLEDIAEPFVDVFKNSLQKPRKTYFSFGLSTIPSLIKTAFKTAAQVTFLIPLTITNDIIENLYYSIRGRSKTKSSEYVTVKAPNLKISPKKQRKYDAVIFGSTGYAGGHLVDYLAKTYGSNKSHEGKKFKWAITGRNESKLKNVIATLSKKYPGLDSLEYIIADTKNFEQVEKIANQAKVVMTTVGPYSLLGNELINACALYGTDYVDVTGEDEWYQSCIDNMQDLAVKSGARLVSFCGHDSVPWDLSTYFMHQEFKNKHNQNLKKIEFYDQVVGNISGGTIASIFRILDVRQEKKFAPDFKEKRDPYEFLPGGNPNKNFKTINKNARNPHFDFKTKMWSSFFLMADLNCKVVERSNSLVGYGDNIEYGEKKISENFRGMFSEVLSLLTFVPCIMCKPIRFLTNKFILPKSGEVMELAKPGKHYLSIWAEGTGTEGKKLYNEMHFYKEPGYVETARMLAESGLSFVFNNDEIEVGGGFWTPASALNKVLLRRITETGTDFGFYDPSENPLDKNSSDKNSLDKNSLEKNSLDKNSLDKNSLDKNSSDENTKKNN